MANEISAIGHLVFTASGTYTPSANMQYAMIECWGGGGGGGGVGNSTGITISGGGGGSGGYTRHLVTGVSIGASKAVTIGAGGAGGAAGANGGTAGGTTSLGTICTAPGGAAGGGSQLNSYGAYGGAGGAAGTGNLAANGQYGQSGYYLLFVGSIINSGTGANSSIGGGGLPATPIQNNVAGGNVATGRAAGGGGAGGINVNATAAGGAGTAGLLVVTEFIGNSTAIPPGDQLVADKIVLQTAAIVAASPVAKLTAIQAALDEIALSRLEVSMNHGAVTVTAGTGTATEP